jgi:hypothetical protein
MNLKKNVATILLLCTVTLGLALNGCSSGGSSDSAAAPNQSRSTVYGIASLGATTPGTVSAKDSSVPAQEKTAAISSNGSFTVDVSGLNPPFVIKASSTDNSGTIEMYSVSMAGGRTHINPVTDVAVNAAAKGTSRDVLYTMPDQETYRRTADDFELTIRQLQTVLAPLFALYQVSGSPVDDDNEDENSGLRAMFRDVQIVVNQRIVTVTNRQSGSVIFSGPLDDLASGIFYPESMPAGPAVSAASNTCSSFTYNDWGTCTNGTQTRTVAASSPAGCTGGTPVLSQSCTDVSPTPACGSCHAIPPSSGQHSFHNSSLAYQCSACHGVGYTKTVVTATTHQNGTVNTAASINFNATASSCSPGCHETRTWNAPTCSSFTYSAWGACQSDNTQTRTVATSSPAGCTGGTPILSQSCTYVPPVNACTSFTYNGWGTCTNGTQTRTVATSSPTGCTGGSPVLSQSCTSPSTLTLAQVTTTCTQCHGLTVNGVVLKSGGYTVSGRSASAWVSSITGMFTPPAGTTVQDFANFLAGLSSAPSTCSSFTYNGWGTCTNGTQTRTIATSSPTGCTGGSPVLSQSCTSATTCSSFTYNGWGTCTNGTQTRTVATSSPTGCSGGSPVLSQSCTSATTCSSFTYSAWGACQSNNTQTRTIATSSPAGCTGGTPVLSQSCTYVPPTPVCGSCHAIPPSSGKHSFHVNSQGYQCSTCHGTGYTSTAVTATTHQNGVVNTVASINFNASASSCSPSCHGTRTW